MDKQPFSLTEQVKVILSPDPQAREIGVGLLRKAAADMGLSRNFEDFISDTPSLFMVFNPVTENRPFAQTIADAMPVSRQHDMIKFTISHSLNEHCDGYASIKAGKLIEFTYAPCGDIFEDLDRDLILTTLTINLYRFSNRKDNMLTDEKLVKLINHYPYKSQCTPPEGSSDGPVAPPRPRPARSLPILSEDILQEGDEVWIIYEGEVLAGRIDYVPDIPFKDIETISIYFNDVIGAQDISKTDVFLRREAAETALRLREYKAVQDYLKEIRTLDDLHQFPLQHVLTGPKPDYAARMAYEIKRVELNP